MSAGQLVILNDPAGVTGLRRLPLDYTASLQDNIARHLSGGAGAELRINGRAVDPLTDPRLDRPPARSDSVVLTLRPEGLDPVTLAYIAVAAVASVAVSYALIPNVNTATATKESPNNRLSGQTNVARAYQAVPDVYGFRRVWPDLIQPSTVEYIDHVKFVTEWLCVSRGYGDITDVRYGDTPITDVAGASWSAYYPEQVGPVPPGGVAGLPEFQYVQIPGVIEAFECRGVNGQEISYPTTSVMETFSLPSVNTTSGSATFTLAVTDDAKTAVFKALVPSGTATVIFDYGPVESPSTFNDSCTVSGFSVSGGVCTFTLVASSPWGSSISEAPIYATMEPDAATSTFIVGPFTLPIDDATRIRWNTIFLRGLKGTVQIEATWQQVDSSGDPVPGTQESQTFNYVANTFDSRYFTTEVTPTAGAGRYEIQFERLTAEIGTSGADIAKLEAVYAVRYYENKTLPGVTVVKVVTQATEQATGLAERRFNLWWQRHVRTLSSDSISASRNFARAMVHLWRTNSQDVAELDTTALAAINTEFGETDDLLRFDMSLDDRDMSLGERMQLMASHARCTMWRNGTKWTVTRDQARQYPDVTFDYRNLAEGGDSVITDSLHLPGSNDGVELEYVDEATQAKKAYVRLTIASGSIVVVASANPKQIKLPGCTTETQATNRARLEARKLLYQRRTVADKALADAWDLGPGSLVRWIDPNDFGGIDDGLQAGEVMAISGTELTTSEPLDFGAEADGRIMFTDTSGQRLAAPVVCTPTADPYVVTLATAPSGIFVASSTRQLGSRYVFGVGLSDAELEAAGLYTVADVKPDGRGEFSMTLVNYDERVYADD